MIGFLFQIGNEFFKWLSTHFSSRLVLVPAICRGVELFARMFWQPRVAGEMIVCGVHRHA